MVLPHELGTDNLVLTAFATLVLSVLTHSILSNWKTKLPKGVKYPPHVSSWVPFLGSAIELSTAPVRHFVWKHTKNSPFFTANIAGTKCLFVSADYLSLIDKERPELDSLSLGILFLRNCLGFTKKEVDLAYGDAQHAYKGLRLMQTHLLPRESLHHLIAEVEQRVANQLDKVQLHNDNNEWTTFRLQEELVETVVFQANVGAIISPSLATEDIQRHFAVFHNAVPIMFAGAPSFLTRQAQRACQAMAQEYHAPNFDKKAILQARSDLLGYSNAILAKSMVGILFATVANSIPTLTWAIAHLLEDPIAYQACQEAADAIVKDRNPADVVFTLEELDELPVISSVIFETLRVYQTLFVVRQVVDDFILNPKDSQQLYMAEKGTRLMALSSCMHHDADIFENPEEFQYDRFLNPNAKSKNNKLLSSYLKPFGGGLHLCPGRKVTLYETRAMLAMLLVRFDVQWADGESSSFPEIDLTKQGASVAYPASDPCIQLRPRRQGAVQ